ncbi:MAG: hypothetical protein WBK08_18675 [Nitrospira sp.]
MENSDLCILAKKWVARRGALLVHQRTDRAATRASMLGYLSATRETAGRAAWKYGVE